MERGGARMTVLASVLIGLGIKAGSNLIDAITARLTDRGAGSGGFSFDTSGELIAQPSGGVYAGLWATGLDEITVEVLFALGDPWCEMNLDESYPSLLLLVDLSEESDIGVVGLPCSLGETIELNLIPGWYSAAVLVFHPELQDVQGDPVLVAWEEIEPTFFDADGILTLAVGVDQDFARDLFAVLNDVIFDSVKTTVANVLEIEGSRIHPETKLTTLGADELDIVEILMGLEDEFSVNLGDDLPPLTRVGHLVDLVGSQL
jgi:acyl carrier protein